MRTAILVLSLALTGCATAPSFLARAYNNADPCQLQNNGGNLPSFCGAGSGRTVIYSTPTGNPVGAPIGYTKSR